MMRENRRHLWLLQIAVLAIAGMVSTATATAACASRDGNAPRACCVDLPPPERGCCEPNRTPPPASAESSSDATVFVLEVDSSSSCECRASDPAAPADHQVRTSSDRFETEGYGLSPIADPSAGSPPQIDRSTLPNERPPKVPLYLRTSRLLN